MNRNLTAFIMIVIAVGIYLTVTQGLLDQAGQVKTVNDQYSTAIANATRLSAMRQQVLDDYNKISDNDRARLDKMIPSTVDNIRLTIDLEGLASDQHLTLQGLTATVNSADSALSAPSPAASTGAAMSPSGAMGNGVANQSISAPVLDTVGVSFGVTATYDQFMTLLQAIEADLRIMDLTHLSMTVSDTGVYNFSLQFNTYWLRQTS